MRIAAYVRVSTQEQAQEGYSIGEQTERLKKYCEAKDWQLVKVYTDAGYSGAKLNRPAIQELINECRRYDMVLVYKLDRLSRSQKDTLYLIEDVFKKNGVDFASMQENFDTSTPLGVAMVGILSVFAQLEREQIKERLSMGKDGRVKEGYWTGTIPPIGYSYDREQKTLVPNHESDQIKDVFRLFLSGMSQKAVWRYMNDHYPNTHYNSATTIKQIIDNPVYCGKMVWRGDVVEGKHEPIVTIEEYERAKDIKMQNRGRNRGRQKHLLTGLCFCGVCGSRMDYSTSRSPYKGKVYVNHYYVCAVHNGRIEHSSKLGMKCDNERIRADELEEAVIGEVLKIRLHDIKAPKPVDNSKQIAAIDRQIEKAMQLFTVEEIDFDKVKSMISELNQKKTSLLAYTSKTQINAARSVLPSLVGILSGDDIQAKIDVLNALIQRVVVTHGDVEIQFAFE